MSIHRSMTSRRTRLGLVCALAVAAIVGPLATASHAAPICPSATANGRFVRQIYLQILERCPDPTAATYWTTRLGGGLARGVFAETIDVSNENMVKNNVDPAFLSAFGRLPTASERSFWVDQVRRAHGDAVLNATLSSSDEHYSHIAGANPAAKDNTWLTEAFQNILDRPPDSGARTYFLGQLGPGASTEARRLRVALVLEFSEENAEDWVGAVYGAAFGRAPDGDGFGYWVGWLLGPGQFQTFRMWTQFLSSNEGYALAQTQPNPQQTNVLRR